MEGVNRPLTSVNPALPGKSLKCDINDMLHDVNDICHMT